MLILRENQKNGSQGNKVKSSINEHVLAIKQFKNVSLIF